jgi:NitT/TauT family transport system permease protein
MARAKHTRHYLSYPITLGEKLYSIFIGPILVVFALFLFVKYFPSAGMEFPKISFGQLILAVTYTLGRLFTAYVLALVCAIPLALLATENSLAEKLLLPTFDILESIPVLAFFPILIIFFISLGAPEGAAIFILFMSMLWNIVFTVVGGLKIIPQDIKYASQVFKIRGWKYVTQVILPAIFPEIVTGSILALAQGWNIIIVAEVIHTYMPMGSQAQDLFGIGSIMVNASATGDTHLFIACLAVMMVVIALFNYFVWQKLIRYAERFKFE